MQAWSLFHLPYRWSLFHCYEKLVLIVSALSLFNWNFLILPWFPRDPIPLPTEFGSSPVGSFITSLSQISKSSFFLSRPRTCFKMFGFKTERTNWSVYLTLPNERYSNILEKDNIYCVACYFTFLITTGITFPEVCTSTLPNKARYLVLNLSMSEEAWRPLFLENFITMEKYPFREM